MKLKPLLLLLLITLLAAPLANAQSIDDPAAMERMDRLERDIMLLQRQLARGEPLPAAATANLAPLTEEEIAASGGPASLDVRLSNMEDEMRVLRGKVEEVEFQNRKLAENFEKFQKDTEFRFGELQGGAPMSDPAAATGSATERKPLAENGDVPASGTTAGDGVLRPPSTQTGDDYATPRDHYNHAFKLLQQTKYDDAAKTFEGFIKKHPKDPLVGNAYYWLGETHYIRRDYVAAADNFRQGFEVLPNGHKAGDNLLKLAMSLNALQRDKEACVVLGQVVTKYKKSSVSITEKAHQEQKRIGCK